MQTKYIDIFTCPDLDTVKERYLKRDFEQQIKLSELERSRNLFCDIFKDIPHVLYKSKNYEELDELIEKVKKIVGVSK